jgi:hypothetical protein
MYTRPLTHQPITVLEEAEDLPVLRRLLTAAALNSRFCARLLAEPVSAAYDGFGGEAFPLSESTMNLLVSIQAASLPEFIQQLDARLSNRLLTVGYVGIHP